MAGFHSVNNKTNEALMDPTTVFKDQDSNRLWQNFFKKVDRITAVLDTRVSSEIKKELQNNLYESFLEQSGRNESEKLLRAIELPGEPEDFLKETVAEELLRQGARTLSPQKLLQGLLYNISGSFKNLLRTFFFILAYLMIILFAVISLSKFLIPDHVGLFVWPDGSWNFGIINHTDGARELLDFWIIPITLMTAFIFYFLVTQVLILTLKKK